MADWRVRSGGYWRRLGLRVRVCLPNSAGRQEMGNQGRKPAWYDKPDFVKWAKPRGYPHFDYPVNEKFARQVIDSETGPDFVANHAFSPLLHYNKVTKMYKKEMVRKNGKLLQVRTMKSKERPIKYASHRDAFIYSWYGTVGKLG